MRHNHSVVALALPEDRGSNTSPIVQPLINLICQQPKAVPSTELKQSFLVSVGCYPTQWVRRGGIHQQACPRVDGSLECLEIDLVAGTVEHQGNLSRHG